MNNADDDRDVAAASGAYVLHGLDDVQTTHFEALMATSETLRAEVTELSDTAVELGLSVTPEAPPAALRARLLEQVAVTPQLAPVDTTSAAPASAPAPGPAERAARQRWFRRPVAVVLTAAAAVALIAGGIATATVVSNSPSSQISAIESASDVQRTAQQIDGGGTATVVWSSTMKKAGIVVSDVPALKAGKTYELWYIGDDGPRPAGTFDRPGDVMLQGSMRSGDRIGMTVEPAGGSSTPTGEAILAVAT